MGVGAVDPVHLIKANVGHVDTEENHGIEIMVGSGASRRPFPVQAG